MSYCKLVYFGSNVGGIGVDKLIKFIDVEIVYSPTVTGVEKVRFIIVAPDGSTAFDLGEHDVTVQPGQIQTYRVKTSYVSGYFVEGHAVEYRELGPNEEVTLVDDMAYIIYAKGDPGSRVVIYLNDAKIIEDELVDFDGDGVARKAWLLYGYPKSSKIKNGSNNVTIVLICIKTGPTCKPFYLYYQEVPISTEFRQSNSYISSESIIITSIVTPNEYTIELLEMGK